MGMTEQWRDIKGFEGLYQISNIGRVKSLRHKTKKGWRGGATSRTPDGIMKTKECCTGNRGKGYQTYLQVKLTKDGKHYHHLLHRLVAEAFVENPQCKKTVNHKNGDRHDNRAENLEWATQSENVKHSYNTLGRKVSVPKGKRVMCVETGEIFESEREASRKYGIKNSSQIGSVCIGRKKYGTAAGKHWVFVR